MLPKTTPGHRTPFAFVGQPPTNARTLWDVANLSHQTYCEGRAQGPPSRCPHPPSQAIKHGSATVGLVPTCRNRFGVLTKTPLPSNPFTFVGLRPTNAKTHWDEANLAHQTYCEGGAQGPPSRCPHPPSQAVKRGGNPAPST